MVVIRVATSASTNPTSTATTYCTRTSLSARRTSKRLHRAPSLATEHHDGGDDKHDQCHAEQDDLHAFDYHDVIPPSVSTSYKKGLGLPTPALAAMTAVRSDALSV